MSDNDALRRVRERVQSLISEMDTNVKDYAFDEQKAGEYYGYEEVLKFIDAELAAEGVKQTTGEVSD